MKTIKIKTQTDLDNVADDFASRITPNNIISLKENEIMVFGSNLSGIHGAGAAYLAHTKFGAEWSCGIGRTGQCYAIPTKSHGIERTLTISEINHYVEYFLTYAWAARDHYTFLVTEIGCGLAGYSPEDIAPLFKEAVNIPNIHLPKRFWEILLP